MIESRTETNSVSLGAALLHWAAWAPGLNSKAEWQQWALGERMMGTEGIPDVGFLPPMLRRRLSRLSKMALYVAYSCLPVAQPVRMVFASRHGDFGTTYTLLQSITQGEPLSPTAFSMSVHNTSAGYYSIARRDTSASTALASGDDSLESGFLDAASLLCAKRSQQVLLVYADEPLPCQFQRYCSDPFAPHAVALLLSAESGEQSIRLQLDEVDEKEAITEPHALALLRMLIRGESQLRLSTQRVIWRWVYDR